MRSLDIGPADGRPLVLLPGNDLGAHFYVPLAKVMARAHVRTRLLTLPGYHGEAPLPELGWPSLIDAVTPHVPANVTLVGHSLGGLLAILVAARVPTAGLVLLEPAVPPGRRAARWAADRYERDVVSGQRSGFESWSGTFHRVADLERFPKWAIDHYEEVRRTSDVETARALVRTMPDLYPLPRVDVPVRVLRGACSGWAARVNATYVQMKLTNVRVSVVPGVAHWMANEDDETLAAAILE